MPKEGLSCMFLAFLFGVCGAIVAEVLKRWQQWYNMPEKRFLALLQSKEFWLINALLILIGGTVGLLEGQRARPFDWSVCFLVSVGAVTFVRNFLSGLAARGSSRAKRRRLKRQLRSSQVSNGVPGGSGRLVELERKGHLRPGEKGAFEASGPPQESILEETERALQKAIRLYPQNAEAHYILGVLLKERGRLEEAGQAFEGAIRLNLQNAEAHYNLGVSLKERGQFEEAERAFQTAIRLNPQDAPGSAGIGGTLWEPRRLEPLSSLTEKADGNLLTPIGWRDIFN